MSKRRMFSLAVLETDAFLDMPLSAQALYFHLCLRADDDGFIGSPQRITKNIGASIDDLKLLIAKRFVLAFEDGVIVIKHWRMHNAIRKDRYTETNFREDLALLGIKDNGAYTFKADALATSWQPNGNQMATQVRLGKESNTNKKPNIGRFAPPTLEEVTQYCKDRGNTVDPQQFISYYESVGWRIGGKSPMKDWRAAVRTWERNRVGSNKPEAKEPADNRADYDAEMKDIWLREYRKRNGGGNEETT